MHKWFVRTAGVGACMAMLSLSAASAPAQSYQYTPYSAPSTTPNFNGVPGYSVVPPATVNPPTPIVGAPHTHFSPSVPYGGGYWGPGGFSGAAGSPYYYNGGAGGGLPGDPYSYHFGPGYYRSSDAGHYRFPWYSYRRPWYYPGHVNYNRDTNLPW